MSTEATTKAVKTKVLRKATFTEVTKNGKREFHAVNKRAHKWARKQGKRSVLSLAQIKAIKATKKVKVCVYTPAGLRVAKV